MNYLRFALLAIMFLATGAFLGFGIRLCSQSAQQIVAFEVIAPDGMRFNVQAIKITLPDGKQWLVYVKGVETK